MSAFGVFCLGNVISIAIGGILVIRTSPMRRHAEKHPANGKHGPVPTSRELLGFSMWLGVATASVAAMPLIMRAAATFDSYTVVAVVDVALVLLSIPQRLGAVIVSAVVPHATRGIQTGKAMLTISRREHLFMVVPFVLAALIVTFTPILGWLFGALGRPEYAKSTSYFALALLAGPARILYGLVAGVLAAHGQGRFLAFNALAITIVASCVIAVGAALGSIVVGFIAFTVACWAIYLNGLLRINRVASDSLP